MLRAVLILAAVWACAFTSSAHAAAVVFHGPVHDLLPSIHAIATRTIGDQHNPASGFQFYFGTLTIAHGDRWSLGSAEDDCDFDTPSSTGNAGGGPRHRPPGIVVAEQHAKQGKSHKPHGHGFPWRTDWPGHAPYQDFDPPGWPANDPCDAVTFPPSPCPTLPHSDHGLPHCIAHDCHLPLPGPSGEPPDEGNDPDCPATPAPTGPVVAAVPEPASMVLWGIGALSVALAARRRQPRQPL